MMSLVDYERDSKFKLGPLLNNKELIEKSKAIPCVDEPYLLPEFPDLANKLLVVIDLDETLTSIRDYEHLFLRPNARELLEFLATLPCKVIFWSAGRMDYVRVVVALFNATKTLVHGAIARGSWEEGKNLNLLSCSAKFVVLIDDKEICCRTNAKRSIRISPFRYDSHETNVLQALSKLMEAFRNAHAGEGAPLSIDEFHRNLLAAAPELLGLDSIVSSPPAVLFPDSKGVLPPCDLPFAPDEEESVAPGFR